jgi:excisionase family DNA binding protein
MASPYLSVGEVATLLRMSDKWTYQQLNKGNIPGAFRIGINWFIDRQTFEEALRERAKKPNRIPDKNRDRHNLA